MTRFLGGSTTVLAGYGFDDEGPYLKLNDIDRGESARFPVQGRTFSLRRLPRRRCVGFAVRGKTFTLRRLARRLCTGRFDLQTNESVVCPLDVELLPDSKETACPACLEATGFNPSFYYADFISPQQRAYNQTPHFVYLAYFSPQHVKAGISSERRGIERLLEQGARAACVVGRFANADEARALEAALCAQPGVLETMRASLKARLLVEERYDAGEAARILDEAASHLAAVSAVAAAGFAPEEARDLSSFYFDGPSPDVHDLQLAEGCDGVCGGRCVGMVGGALVFEQGGLFFVAPIREWESHEVDVLEDEVLCAYEAAPQQFSLF